VGRDAVFVVRKRQQKFPLAPAPNLDVPDLGASDALAAWQSGRSLASRSTRF
jgi:hypothetical protein